MDLLNAARLAALAVLITGGALCESILALRLIPHSPAC